MKTIQNQLQRFIMKRFNQSNQHIKQLSNK